MYWNRIDSLQIRGAADRFYNKLKSIDAIKCLLLFTFERLTS